MDLSDHSTEGYPIRRLSQPRLFGWRSESASTALGRYSETAPAVNILDARFMRTPRRFYYEIVG